MRPFTFPITIGASLLLVGCIQSLHPLVTEETAAYDPAILGVWEQAQGESTWAFTQKETNVYNLTYTDKQGKAGRFEARLVKLGDHVFMDLLPDDPQEIENGYYKFHLLRVHTFLKVSLDGSDMELAGMDPNWLAKRLEADPGALRHEKVHNLVVITAASDELQQFVRRHAEDKDAFRIVIKLARLESVALAGTP
jgi:hypothetical protein